MVVRKWIGKWFVFSKIEVGDLLYFNNFSILYSANKTPLIFLIYYKFAIVESYGEPVTGVTAAKP